MPSRTVRVQHIASPGGRMENAIYLGPSVLVESGEIPGQFYVVEGGRCSCQSYQYRGTCRHTAVAEEATREGLRMIADEDALILESLGDIDPG